MTLSGFSVKAASEESSAFRVNALLGQYTKDFAAELL
jgi:hypothetical protein